MPNLATFRSFCVFCTVGTKKANLAVCAKHRKNLYKSLKYVGFLRPIEYLNRDCFLETKYEYKIEEKQTRYKKVCSH